MSLRSYFNSIEPHFEKGGKFEKYYPLFEMVETIFFTSNTVTKVAPHARSFVDMKRVMTYVVISTIPCVLWALYNTGFQTNSALSSIDIKVSRLARGVPVGGELDYMDDGTLLEAIESRQPF